MPAIRFALGGALFLIACGLGLWVWFCYFGVLAGWLSWLPPWVAFFLSLTVMPGAFLLPFFYVIIEGEIPWGFIVLLALTLIALKLWAVVWPSDD